MRFEVSLSPLQKEWQSQGPGRTAGMLSAAAGEILTQVGRTPGSGGMTTMANE